MRHIRIFIALFCLTVFPYHLFSQAERFRLLDTGNGLFNNQVRFITQMEDGKILAYTEGMFNVYNGHTFEPLACDLTHTVPLGMHNICTAYDAGDGLLWAKDYYRLYLIDTRTQRFCLDVKERFRAAVLNGTQLNDFILDRDKKAWLITEDGSLYRYDWIHAAQMVYRPTPQEIRAGIRVKDVMQAGPFHLIFLNTGRMMVWEEKTGRIIGTDDTAATPEGSLDAFRTAWLPADDQNLLISISHTKGYVYLYNIYTRQWKALLEGKIINDIQKDKEGNFWLGGNNLLIQLSPQYKVLRTFDRFNTENGKDIQDFVMSVLIDRTGGVWLGTGSSGILKSLPEKHYVRFYPNDAADRDEGRMIRSLAPYDDHHLIAGTLHGLFLFDTRGKNYAPFLQPLGDAYCHNIQRDAKGHLWLSTRKGLYLLKDGECTRHDQHLPQGNPPGIIRFSLPLKDGRLLVCSGLKDLYLYDPQARTYVRLGKETPGLQRARVMSFATETAPGKLLIGGQSGLFEYDGATDRLEPAKWIQAWEQYSIKYNCVLAQDSVIYLGTQNGLLIRDLKDGTVRRMDMHDGLPNNCIQGITPGNDGSLWISTSSGIAHLLPGKDGGTFSVARLDGSDGVQPGEMMEQSIAAMPDGHVYVGGINGITDIPPGATDYSDRQLRPTLVGLRVMNQSLNNEGLFHGRQLLPDGMSHTGKFHLKYNENFIEMKFSALDYDTPQHTRYRYRLDGVDKGWNHSADPSAICTATYTSLTPGTYTLQVQAAMGYGPWGDAGEWEIAVSPPLWKTWWAYCVYVLIAIGILYYVIELYIADKRSRMVAEQEAMKRQKEQHLDELKFRFFTNISHEFRTPLALIITPLELLIRNTGDQGLKGQLEKILGNAKDLLRLVNQLLDFRRLEQKGEQLKPSSVNIKEFIEGGVRPFEDLARERHVELVCECQFTNEDIFRLDAQKMTRVMNNLLSNALKFTPEGGIITVWAGWQETATETETPAGIRITVSDTGTGIKPEDLENIFTRFYQSDSPQSSGMNTGSGIGLHLVKGYVDLHKGDIRVESKVGKGTTFTITLPWPEQQATAATVSQPPSEAKEYAHGKTGEKDVTLLVAEDNEQFRTFMKDLLGHDYHVLTAADGQEGLDMARNYNPDLIISDVMMPRMDGYEFCRHIKTDMKCSHIPFILLTAKNSSESRSGAYEAGADSFIAKPFDIDVLNSRIHQLLEQRERRIASFKEETRIDPKEITITSLDEKLIRKALECIEKNMDNTEYNVEALSADMGIERTSLYRKMQAIAGQTPTEFMRTVRLKRAAVLLEKGQYTVQEISWMVGFNTPRYFSSYFKEMFGVTPSQYAARKRKPDTKA